jgi:ArsR family transcriptional regulator, arsenate/arsenite/antimonite-responsive transcriptional repressor
MLRELSEVAQALSDPMRLRILKLLAMGDLCVCELVYLLPASQSRVSQNMAILKYAGLVTDTRDGRRVHYSLNRAILEQALSDLRKIILDAGFDALPEMTAEAERRQRMLSG